MRRMVGIDMARGLALLGMFVTHAAPAITGGVGAFLESVPEERSRLLFAITAGLGLGLLTGGDAAPAQPRSVLRGQIAIRALCLIFLGVTLQATGVLVYVILDEYGVAFLIMIPLVFLPPRWLLGLGGALLAVAPGAAYAAAQHVAVGTGGPFADWFVTGPYPVLSWVAVMLLGVGIIRLGVRRRAVVAVVGIGGLLAAVMGLALSIALGGEGIKHAAASPVGASAFTIGNVGVGLALTMGLVALTSWAPGHARIATIGSPLAAAGSMPLSVYSLHIVVLVVAIHPGPGGYATDDSWWVLLGLVGGTLTLPWLWRRYLGRGPLELIIGRISGRVPARARQSPSR